MATLQQRRSHNVDGNFYVDNSCIDCDTCRWMAPTVFHRDANQSAVYHQPADSQEEEQALQALLSCPTASIGTVAKPDTIRQVQQSFPIPIAGTVYHCGYHAASSFAAASYFIQHPEGNILVDSPRFTPPLVKQLEAMGGLRYLYLTHRDDVVDHAKFHAHFGCDRILHHDDITPETQDIEYPLHGTDPIQLTADLTIIPVPGHTKGHTVLLYQDRYLFTGDHLAWSATLGHLNGFRRYCWYSWEQQIASMQQLLNYAFHWILPGHGRRYTAPPEQMRQQLQDCITWMQTLT